MLNLYTKVKLYLRMLSKEEKKEINSQFFEGFKKHMKGTPSYGGSKPQWLNYRLGIKNFYLRLQVDQHGAKFCLDFQHKDEDIRSLLWDQLEEFKSLLEKALDREVIWTEILEGSTVPTFRIHTEIREVSFYQRSDWPQIYAFYKSQLVAFDEFWEDFSDPIKALMN